MVAAPAHHGRRRSQHSGSRSGPTSAGRSATSTSCGSSTSGSHPWAATRSSSTSSASRSSRHALTVDALAVTIGIVDVRADPDRRGDRSDRRSTRACRRARGARLRRRRARRHDRDRGRTRRSGHAASTGTTGPLDVIAARGTNDSKSDDGAGERHRLAGSSGRGPQPNGCHFRTAPASTSSSAIMSPAAGGCSTSNWKRNRPSVSDSTKPKPVVAPT